MVAISGINSKPRILVVGGSGRTGKLVIDEALRRGHPVTALIRSSASLSTRDGLTIVEGSPLNQDEVEKAIVTVVDSKPTVVISTLGQTRKSGNPWAATTSPPRLMANSIKNITEIARQHGLQKIVVMSMFGAGNSFSNLNFLMRWIMKGSNMSQTLEDQNLVDEGVKKSGVSFVMARSCMLKGDAAAPIVFHGDDGDRAGFMPSISPQSVAVFLLDAAERVNWDNSTPVISN